MEINLKKNYDKKWIGLMEYGKRLGCHQRPERSFFIKGYQLPVCARCTGVIPASFVAVIVFFYYKVPIIVDGMFCFIMFCDWFFQKIGWCMSTNLRRFITGILGGFGFMTLQMYAYQYICIQICNLIK